MPGWGAHPKAMWAEAVLCRPGKHQVLLLIQRVRNPLETPQDNWKSTFTFFFFFSLIYYFASLTFASGSGMIWDWCTGWKHHEITGTLSLSAGRLWDGCWEAMHCSAAPVCVHCRSRLMGWGQIKVPPGSCMQRMSAWIVCRGVLLFQTVFLEQ